MEYKACLKIILINCSGANVAWHNPPVVTYLASSYFFHFHSSYMPVVYEKKKGGGGCETNTEFPLSWQNSCFLPCHHHLHTPNTHRCTCIGAIAEDAGSRCDRIVRTVFLSACWACFESSVCVTSEWDRTCPRGDPEAAARLWDPGTISGLWLEVSSWSVVEGTYYLISQVFNLLRATVHLIMHKMSVPAPRRVVHNHY
jgi:hypothetical protein